MGVHTIKTVFIGFIIILLLLGIGNIGISSPAIGSDNDHLITQPPLATPSGYIHRPIVEFFTGLSCPSCMNGPHQDMEKLWEENREIAEQPYTYIVFQELNGGGVDDLATEESKERMRYYQPGVSGTPDAELDGGYIKLGGLSATSISYQTAKQGVDDCKNRFQNPINPLRPLQSLRSGFKYVELFVEQVFTGSGYAVSVEARYLGTDNIISLQQLRGSLYVFMIEDNVEAYSTVEESVVTNNNVFRGYAVKAHEFTLSNDETYSVIVDWPIPEATVPIKPGDITAVAAVYDLDDTSSQQGSSGNDAQVPRCIQSATPKSTAFDKENDMPIVTDVSLSYNGELKIDASIDDENGVTVAYVIYNTESSNSTSWENQEMELSGKEVCDDNGICFAYADTTASAVIPVDKGETVYYMILAYDGAGVESGGLGAQGKTEIYNYTTAGGGSKKADGLSSMGTVGAVLGVLVVLFILFILFKNKDRWVKKGNKGSKPDTEETRVDKE